MVPFDLSAFRPRAFDYPIQRSYWLPRGLLSLLSKIARNEGATAPYLVRRFAEQLEEKWEPKAKTKADETFLEAVRAGMSASDCKIFTVWLKQSTVKRIEECASFYSISRSHLVAALIAEAVRSYAELKKQPELRVDLVKLELLPKLEKDQAA